MTHTRSAPVRSEIALVVGFLAVTVALLAAYSRPATGYELSIYRATPTVFWVGIGLGFLSAIYVSTTALHARRHVDAALLLATICGVAVVALPVIRSYTFYGAGDSLSHLGWAREIQTGTIPPTDVVYPGVHLTASALSALTGDPLTRTLQYVPTVVFPLVFVVFTVLCLRVLTESRWAPVVGVFSAVLFVPINQISVHVVTHPTSQAILFLPVVLYVLFRFLLDESGGLALTTAFGVLLLVVGLALLLVHPQETFTFLSLLGGIWLLQVAVRRGRPDHPIAAHRSVFAPLILLLLTHVLWTSQHARARTRVSSTLGSILNRGPTTLTETAERGTSLATLGGSFEELFLKLFAVTVVFCLLGGAVMLANVFGLLDNSRPTRTEFVSYLTAGLVFPTIGFFVIFVADQGDHYFRFLGFIMVPITLLGAVALAELSSSFEGRLTDARAQTGSPTQQLGDGGLRPPPATALAVGVAVLFLVMAPVQAAVVHQSPYMYQPNDQVTAAEMAGHERIFELHDGESELTGLRTGPNRFADAYYGTETVATRLNISGYMEGVPGPSFGHNITSFETEDVYLVLTLADYRHEVELYRGLRYSRAGFRAIERNRNVSRVQDNGEVRLYRVYDD